MYDCIKPGKIWNDTSGKPIQAHGFSVFYKDGVYYWYGENKEYTKAGGRIWHWGVRCYRSEDLYNWEDMGLIIPPQPDDLSSPLHPTYCMDRPHIIYCLATKKYVAWLKVMGEGTNQFFSVLQADAFCGPYTFVRKVYQPLKMNAGDFCFAQSGGKAYVIFERPHFEMICATLSDDYTSCSGEYSAHYGGRKPPLTREAPTYFERNGKKYVITSGTSGYFPNKSLVSVFDDFHGEWRDLGDPCAGDGTDTTFNSQITCVLKVPGTELYVAMADRWVPNKLMLMANKTIQKVFTKMFAGQEPDTSPQEERPLPGKEKKHGENTFRSRYVWLPVEWQGEKPVIRWRKEWRVEDYR